MSTGRVMFSRAVRVGQRLVLEAADVDAVDVHPSGRRCVQGGHAVHQRGLAGP
jgi:hypothetical protein